MEDCGYGPGLEQITVTLTVIPTPLPMPLCTSTPKLLNCSALTSTCHLLSPPYRAESPLPHHHLTSHTTTPLTGRTHRQAQRQADKRKNHTHPHIALLLSNASLCH